MSVEINDAVFCQSHIQEMCDDCEADYREENDAFYGFSSNDREALTVGPVKQNQDGLYICEAHESSACNQCFGWKRQIMRLQKAAKRAS